MPDNPTIPARIAAAREQLQRNAWMIQPTALHFVLDMLDGVVANVCTVDELNASEHLPLVTQHAAALRTLTRIEQLLEETK